MFGNIVPYFTYNSYVLSFSEQMRENEHWGQISLSVTASIIPGLYGFAVEFPVFVLLIS